MRLIDGDALIRDLQERYCRPCKASGLDYNGVKCKACQFDDEIDDIDAFADNSIDIVFCKECKHWNKSATPALQSPNAHPCLRAFSIMLSRADDYCSRGEREGER